MFNYLEMYLSLKLRDALRKRNARKRSMATFESDLKKRSRGDSLVGFILNIQANHGSFELALFIRRQLNNKMHAYII